jgi:hypothetical protein
MARWKEDAVEGLAPVLRCLIEIQSALQNGEPVRAGLQKFIQSTPGRDEVGEGFRRLLFAWDQGGDWRAVILRMATPYRRALGEIVVSGLRGQPVLLHLEELRGEIEKACEIEIKRRLELLPMKMLVPLLLFQFPAFLLLLFGPLLGRLILEMNR